MKKNIFRLAFFLGVAQVTFAPEVRMPHLVLNKISNQSAHDLIFKDRVNGNSIEIKHDQQVLLDSELVNFKNIVILGSMIDCMKNDAQFTLRAANSEQGHFVNQETYLNVCAVAGGIDDGSRMITGTLGSVVVKFCMASSLKGCQINSLTLKKQHCDTVLVDLVLTSKPQDMQEGVFRIEGSIQLHEL